MTGAAGAHTFGAMAPLSPTELNVLAAVHRADEEEGGLAFDDVDEEERAALVVLADAGLIETHADDEGDGWARITARGVEVLRESPAA